jgi:ADP-heptose:LPS heptosyltransferase
VLKRVQRQELVVNLVGKTGLRALPNVLAAADLYVGNDSGPKHLAAALGVPTLGIHSESVDSGEWGPMGPNTLTIRRDMTCSPCYLARATDCHRGLACLTGISVAQVFQACRVLLACSANVRSGPESPPPVGRRINAVRPSRHGHRRPVRHIQS